MSPEHFFAFLANNPGEVRQCFHYSLSELLVENRNDFLAIEDKKTSGGGNERDRKKNRK